jgi:geranylgeranyl pyrophosphate synthase
VQIGHFFGDTFQIQDDILNVAGTPEVSGGQRLCLATSSNDGKRYV